MNAPQRIEPPEYDECPTCGEHQFDWPRCRDCGTLSLDYLHNAIRRDIRAKRDEPLSELKNAAGWL